VAEEAGKAKVNSGPSGTRGRPQELDDEAAKPAAEPSTDPLDKYLRLCEKKLTSLDSFVAQVKRTTVDKTFQVTEVYEGTVKYLKPDMSMQDLHMQGNPKRSAKYVCTGSFLYEFSPEDKEIRVHERARLGSLMPKFVRRGFEMLMLTPPFPFSPFVKVEESKRLYQLKLVKEDQWYLYIEVQPRTREAKDDLQRARVVLAKPTYLPRQVWFELPNGNEVTWDIPRIEENVALPRKDFTSPQVPPGWNLRRVPPMIEGAHPKPVPPPDKP
jgi:TIGR03009 family protein